MFKQNQNQMANNPASNKSNGGGKNQNERSDLNAQATDKNKRTQQAGSDKTNWDQTDRPSSDM